MSKNPVKPELLEQGFFGNFDTLKFTTKTHTPTVTEQSNARYKIGKLLQKEYQPTLQDIERQLTPRQAVSERTVTIMTRVLVAITGSRITDIDFWATNFLAEWNAEARRNETQRP
ncbi:MAG: hypothetical protein EZS28_028582 [Streblomastix strix]|uniref:Uncharacterized protein n=1 Tax=Streblomastix strix TaxID=222440 RepID=A0A5J4V1H3_9EUKA|nr:MAG: hypothetical protein EZS28_028582 [Streblomastix strix]